MANTLNPAKYEGKTTTELRGLLLRRDAGEATARTKEQVKAARTRRVVAMGTASAALGIIEEKFPGSKSFNGLPVGIDHVVAVGGTFLSYYLGDQGEEDAADFAEGAAMAGAAPLIRNLAKKATSAASSLL